MNWTSRTHALLFYLLTTAEVASHISLVVSWGLLAIIELLLILLFILIRQINDDDDDDDEISVYFSSNSIVA